MNTIFGNSLDMQQRTLSYLWAKQEVINNNLANAETPGYKTQYISFENEFRNRLEAAGKAGNSKTISQAIENSGYQIYTDRTGASRQDGNGVNIDVQNVEMARTALQYQTLLQSVNSEITRIRSVLK